MSDARGVRRSRREEEEESYFVSMADMMVGLLFIFIILLLYFALQFRQTTDTLTGAGQTRTELLRTLERDLKAKGLKVTVDTRTGVLRLPDNILFETGAYELSPQGQQAVAIVAGELASVLPCYTDILPGGPRCTSKMAAHRVDSVFIEGHTDRVPLTGGGAVRSNLDLSALRATRTFQAMMAAGRGLTMLVSVNDTERTPIFGVSGYGDTRPVPDRSGNEADVNRRNRRIDLRFLMVTPQGEEDAAFSRSLVVRR